MEGLLSTGPTPSSFFYWSRIFTFWTFPEVNILDHFRIFTFRTIPELLHSWPIQNCYNLDRSRIITFQFIPELFSSGPILVFLVLHHSRISTFWTFPEFLHPWPFQIFYVVDQICFSLFVQDLSRHLSEPPEEARRPQPWPAVFTFPSRGRGWLEKIPFVQSWSTHPAVVASM